MDRLSESEYLNPSDSRLLSVCVADGKRAGGRATESSAPLRVLRHCGFCIGVKGGELG